MKTSRLRWKSREQWKGPQGMPGVFSELLREKEVSLSSCGLRGQSRMVGKSCRGKKVELMLWKTFSQLLLEARQVFLSD